jgi:ketosteroid isomerase-like protein
MARDDSAKSPRDRGYFLVILQMFCAQSTAYDAPRQPRTTADRRFRRVEDDVTCARLQESIEAMNRHDAAAATEFMADDVLFWEPSYPTPRRGRTAVRRELEGFFAMLPDIRFRTNSILADGNRAFHEWSYRATYEGKTVELQECAAIRFDADRRAIEVRVYFDRLTLLRQLGMAPEL